MFDEELLSHKTTVTPFLPPRESVKRYSKQYSEVISQPCHHFHLEPLLNRPSFCSGQNHKTSNMKFSCSIQWSLPFLLSVHLNSDLVICAVVTLVTHSARASVEENKTGTARKLFLDTGVTSLNRTFIKCLQAWSRVGTHTRRASRPLKAFLLQL